MLSKYVLCINPYFFFQLNESSEKKTSSPFYEGKTTFGGASAFRRMPASVVPYQVIIELNITIDKYF